MMYSEPGRYQKDFPLWEYESSLRLPVRLLLLLMLISVTLCQSPGGQESKITELIGTTSTSRQSSSPTPILLRTHHGLHTTASAKDSLSQANSWVRNDKASGVSVETVFSHTSGPATSVHDMSGVSRNDVSSPLLSTSSGDYATVAGRTSSWREARPRTASTIVTSKSPSPDGNPNKQASPSSDAATTSLQIQTPHQILSGSVSSLKSNLHDAVTPSEVSAAVVTSKQSVLSSPAGAAPTDGPSRPAATITTTPNSITPQGKTHSCSLKANGTSCVCFNCHKAQEGQKCCKDLIESKTLQQGVVLSLGSISVDQFIKMEEDVKKILAEVVVEVCGVTRCVYEAGGPKKRARRSPRDSSPDPNSNEQAQLESIASRQSSARVEALRPAVNSSALKVSAAEVVIFDLNAKQTRARGVETAFYVMVTSLKNGNENTGVLDGTVLLHILNDKKSALKTKLNLNIDSISKWKRHLSTSSLSLTKSPTIEPRPTAASQEFPSVPSVSPGRGLDVTDIPYRTNLP